MQLQLSLITDGNVCFLCIKLHLCASAWAPVCPCGAWVKQERGVRQRERGGGATYARWERLGIDYWSFGRVRADEERWPIFFFCLLWQLHKKSFMLFLLHLPFLFHSLSLSFCAFIFLRISFYYSHWKRIELRTTLTQEAGTQGRRVQEETWKMKQEKSTLPALVCLL